VRLSTHPGLAPRGPGRADQAAPPGRGAGGWAGRLFRALAQCPGPARQAARGRRRSQKEGLCRRPALGPAARRQELGGGRRRRDSRRRGPPTPPRGGRRHRAWRAPEGGWHRGAPEGVGSQRRGLRSAQAARPGRTGGAAGEGLGDPIVGKTKGASPYISPTWRLLRVSRNPPLSPIIQFKERGSRDSCLLGRAGGVSGPGSAPPPPPVSGERVGWRQGVMRDLEAARFAERSPPAAVSPRHVGGPFDFPFYGWGN
jgi:hypothetical protein